MGMGGRNVLGAGIFRWYRDRYPKHATARETSGSSENEYGRLPVRVCLRLARALYKAGRMGMDAAATALSAAFTSRFNQRSSACLGRFSTADCLDPALCRDVSRNLLGQRRLVYRHKEAESES